MPAIGRAPPVSTQVDRAEAPRIVEREAVVRGLEHQVVVLAEFARIDPPAPAHAEMEHQRRAAVGVDQPVLGAAAEPGDRRPGERLHQTLREADGACPAG